MSFFGKDEIKKLLSKIDTVFDSDEQKEVVNTLVEIIEDLGKALEEVTGQVTEIDEDLSELEEHVYGEVNPEDMATDISTEALTFELQCPACNELVEINLATAQNDKIICPNCQAELDFDGGCGGECGGCHGCSE